MVAVIPFWGAPKGFGRMSHSLGIAGAVTLASIQHNTELLFSRRASNFSDVSLSWLILVSKPLIK